jgi:hypothetical protein
MTNKESIIKHLLCIALPTDNRPGDPAYARAMAPRYASKLPAWADITKEFEAELLNRRAENDRTIP